jgi:hypothetical protein
MIVSPSSKSTKASKKITAAAGKDGAAAGKKARTQPVRMAKAEADFDHSPVIITDGSATVEFDLSDYKLNAGVHVSNSFSLDKVVAKKSHNGQPLHTCFTFLGADHYRIEAVCRVGGSGDQTIVVEGAAVGEPVRSMTVTFNHSVFRTNPNFPPVEIGKTRFAHANRRVISLRITDISTGQVVHNCPLVPGGGVEYTISEID